MKNRSYEKKIYRYPTNRDAVFILGAGASYSDGIPLQSEILPIILSGRYSAIATSKIGKLVIEFIKDNFTYSFKQKLFPTLEEIFSYLDFFINQNLDLNIKYKIDDILEVKESLIKLIHYVISRYSREIFDNFEKPKVKNYRKFWKFIKEYNRNISIITLNYDALLEESFDFLYPDYGLIDYCIHLINYDYPPGMDAFNWWDNPREFIPVWGISNTIPIKIIKIHGSLNWKYCGTCHGILLTPWDTDIDLNTGKFIRNDYEIDKSYIYRCPIDNTVFETLILQPSHVKNFENPIIKKIFNEAVSEIKNSKRLIFIGYSFPDADIHIRAILNIASIFHKEIFVIDTNKSKDFKYKFKSLGKNIYFIESTFEDVLANKKLFSELVL